MTIWPINAIIICTFALLLSGCNNQSLLTIDTLAKPTTVKADSRNESATTPDQEVSRRTDQPVDDAAPDSNKLDLSFIEPSEDPKPTTNAKKAPQKTAGNEKKQTSNSEMPILSERKDGIWARLRKNFAFKFKDSRRIAKQRKRYLRHPHYLRTIQKQAAPFIHYIVEEIEKRNYPGELALLPIVESGYHIHALSSGEAAGLWQFIPATASIYGLKRTWWYDGRNDVIDSTRVALNYFSTLYRKFDKDWFVALAAYNTGDGNITKAIAKNRKRKKSTDYWSLPLKQEPKQYIPKLLALTQIFSNPEKYGIKLEPIPDKPRVALVKTGGQIDLKLAAKLAGTNLTTLRKLNPGYKRWATNPSGPHHLLVPASLAENFNKNIAKLPPDKRIRLKKHHVKAGETLKTIAKSHKTDSYLIRKLNKLKGKNIKVDQKLLIPVAYTQEEIIALGEHEVGDDGSTRLATKDPSNESETETETPNSDLVTSLLKGLLQTP